MELLFSTETETPRNRLQRWKEIVFEKISPADQIVSKESPFAAKIESAEIGELSLLKLSNGAGLSKSTSANARKGKDLGYIFVSMQLSGTSFCSQDDRVASREPGEFVVIDRRPSEIETHHNNSCLVIAMPRDKLERSLGPSRRYTALTVGNNLASTSLATNFFKDLANVSEHFSPAAAARMASIGVDLIVASLAERLARDTPKSLQATIIVHRAKAYVEAHLDDPSLDAPQLAAALGVSLRRLQQLFHEDGRSIANWIWQRRLEVATQRLADPGYAHLSIGALAYGCGFINQAHFSRRFRERHGFSPRDYRWRWLLAKI